MALQANIMAYFQVKFLLLLKGCPWCLVPVVRRKHHHPAFRAENVAAAAHWCMWLHFLSWHFICRRDARRLRRRLIPQSPPRRLKVQTVFLVSREHLPGLPDPKKILLSWWSMSAFILWSDVSHTHSPSASSQIDPFSARPCFLFFFRETIFPCNKAWEYQDPGKAQQN